MGGGASVPTHDNSIATRFKRQGSKGPEYSVFLIENVKNLNGNKFYLLRIAYEALVLLDCETRQPLLHFPYEKIICWGSNPSVFQFKLFGDYFDDNRDRKNVGTIHFQTTNGKEIEILTLTTVKNLMKDMQKNAILKEDFNVIYDLFKKKLENNENWLSVLQPISLSKFFIAKQCVLLLKAIDLYKSDTFTASFEKVDLCVWFYEKLLNPDSFQLLLNEISNRYDRENILHRLGLDQSNFDLDPLINCPDGLQNENNDHQDNNNNNNNNNNKDKNIHLERSQSLEDEEKENNEIVSDIMERHLNKNKNYKEKIEIESKKIEEKT